MLFCVLTFDMFNNPESTLYIFFIAEIKNSKNSIMSQEYKHSCTQNANKYNTDYCGYSSDSELSDSNVDESLDTDYGKKGILF